MLFTRFPLLLAALTATGLSAGAQSPSRSYTSVDAFGNVIRQTVQTPLAGASSVPGLIAQQGILGANTTSSSTAIYGNPYGYNGYHNGGYPPAYGYSYPGTVNNNYYYPAQPSSGPLSPPSYSWEKPTWITNIPIGGGYANNYPNGYGYGYGAPPVYPGYGYGYGYPAYNGTYYNGAGSGTIITQSQNSGYGVAIGRGGVTGYFDNRNSSSSTVVTPGFGYQHQYDNRFDPRFDHRQIRPNRNQFRPSTTVPPTYKR